MLNKRYKIDPEYHGPYMNTWIEQQLEDGDLRVYKIDEQGNKYSPSQYDGTDEWYFYYILIEAIKR